MAVYFYKTSSGRNPIKEFLNEQSLKIRNDFLDAIKILEEGKKLSMPLSKHLFNISRGLFEIRLKDRGGIYRIFYFIKLKDKIHIIHAYKKKTQQIPKRDLMIIKKRIREVKNAVGKNIY